ncbi:MAG: hypothetical protein QXG10_05180, partial [Candidatus Hadarchaeales archaeon]
KVKDVTSLPNILRNLLENYKHDEEQLVNFVAAIFECSFAADFPAGEGSLEKTLTHPDFKAYMEAIAKEMGLR